MKNFIKSLIKNEDGQGLTEYALILGSIAILVMFILMSGIMGHVANLFEGVEEDLGSI